MNININQSNLINITNHTKQEKESELNKLMSNFNVNSDSPQKFSNNDTNYTSNDYIPATFDFLDDMRSYYNNVMPNIKSPNINRPVNSNLKNINFNPEKNPPNNFNPSQQNFYYDQNYLNTITTVGPSAPLSYHSYYSQQVYDNNFNPNQTFPSFNNFNQYNYGVIPYKNVYPNFQTDFQNQKTTTTPSNISLTPDMDELLKNIFEYCKDHSGSRIVQKKFEEATEEDKNKITNYLLPFAYPLTKDVFGNYVIQKILDYSAHSPRKSLIMKQLEGNLYELSINMYGCRVIQKSMDIIDNDLVKLIFKEIKNYVKKCIEDQNGNHVIQKLIERLPREDNLEIIRIIKSRVYETCTHQYGCRVIQKIFEYCREEDYNSLVNEIIAIAVDLCQDQYGNYVIQNIIERQGLQKISKVMNNIKGKVFDFAIHKYASNVIEKTLCGGNYKIRKDIIDEILMKDDQFRYKLCFNVLVMLYLQWLEINMEIMLCRR
jgi:peroxiredoxin family protein